MGDPAGIGLDITLAAWARRAELDVPRFYVLAAPDALVFRSRMLNLDIPVEITRPETAGALFDTTLPVVRLDSTVSTLAGEPNAGNAPAISEAIRRGVADVLDGRASAVVTNPIHKKSLYDAGFSYPGHTEFIASLVEEATGQYRRPVMMLSGPELRTVPATIHVPLADVPKLLTSDLIAETGRIVASELQSRFGIPQPRLAIAGLNPHAGEMGSLGQEDTTIIAPAVESLTRSGIAARGPLPADTMFQPAARQTYDAAICMYHDQALIPVKTLDFGSTVNITLGLPLVRTSPDHGTAFELAGSGRADASGLVAALRLAAQMAGGGP